MTANTHIEPGRTFYSFLTSPETKLDQQIPFARTGNSAFSIRVGDGVLDIEHTCDKGVLTFTQDLGNNLNVVISSTDPQRPCDPIETHATIQTIVRQIVPILEERGISSINIEIPEVK